MSHFGSSPALQGPKEPLKKQMRQLIKTWKAKGYQLIRIQGEGELSQGASQTFPLFTGEEDEYLLIGACDQDCEDLELVVVDPSGHVIHQEKADTVHVRFATRDWTSYTTRISMTHCAAESCAYRLDLMAR